MDLRKMSDMYIDIPLFLLLIYYFYKIKKRNRLEECLFFLIITALLVNILLSFNIIRARYVSWNYFLNG